MNDWTEIRMTVLVGDMSRRKILRETGMHWNTASRRATGTGSRDRGRGTGVAGTDQAKPRKQRRTAKRIRERLREDGFTGGYTVAKDAVRELARLQVSRSSSKISSFNRGR